MGQAPKMVHRTTEFLDQLQVRAQDLRAAAFHQKVAAGIGLPSRQAQQC